MAIINYYANYIREKFGERVQRITVRSNFTCPNRDGTKGINGCTYCNNESFAAPKHIESMSITDQIKHGIEVSKRRYNVKKYLIYFQAYSNTYAPLKRLQELYEEALSFPDVVGICIGTRPDCVDENILNYLESLAKKYDVTVEYGLESISDDTLIKINRGHTYTDFVTAVHLTANRNINIGVHLILGFPWETNGEIIQAAQLISALPIDFVKLHQLHIVKETAMAHDFYDGKIIPLSMDVYIERVILFLEHLSAGVVIQRLYGDAPSHLLIAPDWRIASSEFNLEIERKMKMNNSYQGIKFI